MLSIYIIFFFINQLFSDNKNVPAKSPGNIELQIVSIEKNIKTESCLNAKVLIINNTDTVASFFEDWNSWGWYNISLKVKTSDTTYIINKKDRDWDKNFPSYKTLFPGDTLELKYLLSYGACDSTEFDKLLFKPMTIQAFYKFDKARFQGSLDPDSLIDWHFIYTRVYKKDRSIVIDSIKPPIQVIKTFPTSQLQSKEYTLQN